MGDILTQMQDELDLVFTQAREAPTAASFFSI